MTRLVARELTNLKVGFLSLHGGVPSHKRRDLLSKFRDDPKSLVFLSTDAGGVGLNLQSASIVVNLDMPWNPAVLEQRIARVHRMGQTKPVRVVNFIASGTIEERLLSLISFKKSLFAGVLDGGENDVFMGESKFTKFMKTIEQVATPSAEQAHLPTLAKEEPAIGTQEISEEKAPKAEPMQELFSTGIAFLERLSTVAGNIETDKASGKQCLKIPMPDNETLEKLASAMDAFAKIFKR